MTKEEFISARNTLINQVETSKSNLKLLEDQIWEYHYEVAKTIFDTDRIDGITVFGPAGRGKAYFSNVALVYDNSIDYEEILTVSMLQPLEGSISVYTKSEKNIETFFRMRKDSHNVLGYLRNPGDPNSSWIRLYHSQAGKATNPPYMEPLE